MKSVQIEVLVSSSLTCDTCDLAQKLGKMEKWQNPTGFDGSGDFT